MPDSVQTLTDSVIQYAVTYGFQVIGALIILTIGFIAARWAASWLSHFFAQKKLDITLSKFIVACVRILILAFAVLIALGKFGITIAPFVAALSAVAFGASFALQLPLSNYGAGLTIILTRPFSIGNTITVAGVSGVVQEIKLATTLLDTEEGVRIMVPNKEIVGQILYNSLQHRMALGIIGISYDSSPENAIQAIQKTLEELTDVTKTPKPQIGIEQFADSAINISYRFWVPTVKYYQALHAANLAVFKALAQAGIKIPFPQREIRVLSPVEAKS